MDKTIGTQFDEHGAIMVGKPFNGEKGPLEIGARLSILEDAVKVIIAVPRPSALDVLAANHGNVSLALFTHKTAICLLVRVNGLTPGYTDLPFLATIVPPEYANSGTFTETAHALVTLLLLDSNNGVVEGLRAFTLSPAMTTALRAAMRAQEAAGVTPEQFSADLEEAYALYPDGDAMAADCAFRCNAGD